MSARDTLKEHGFALMLALIRVTWFGISLGVFWQMWTRHGFWWGLLYGWLWPVLAFVPLAMKESTDGRLSYGSPGVTGETLMERSPMANTGRGGDDGLRHRC